MHSAPGNGLPQARKTGGEMSEPRTHDTVEQIDGLIRSTPKPTALSEHDHALLVGLIRDRVRPVLRDALLSAVHQEAQTIAPQEIEQEAGNFERAVWLCQSLKAYPMPRIEPEGDGSIGLDWDEAADRVLAITIDDQKWLGYSYIIGEQKASGRIAQIAAVAMIEEVLRVIYRERFPAAEIGSGTVPASAELVGDRAGAPAQKKNSQTDTAPSPLAQTSAQGWQPIETAPKDKIVIGGNAGSVFQMKYVEGWAEPWATVLGLHPRRPTHWMPLPSPPPQEPSK
jgi:hypothetical protein